MTPDTHLLFVTSTGSVKFSTQCKFLNVQASSACSSVGHTFRFPFCQRLYLQLIYRMSTFILPLSETSQSCLDNIVAYIVADMMADMEVDKVANKVADMVTWLPPWWPQKIDIYMEIQFGESWSGGLANWVCPETFRPETFLSLGVYFQMYAKISLLTILS